MKILKIVYDDDSKFILDIINKLKESYNLYVETYNYNHYKEKKKAIPILTRNGSKQLPFLVFEDNNLVEYCAIWAESNPDWEKEIIKILQE